MNVEIKAIANIESESAELGLTAQLYREKENAKIEFLKSITVPIEGRNVVSGEMLEVSAGKYFLQVLLPDGRTLTKDFEVTPVGGQEEVVIDLPHEGPHEWTSLHAIAGNFRRESRLTEGFTKPLSRNPKGTYKSLTRNFTEGFELSFLKPDENSGDGIFIKNKTIENISNLIRENLTVEEAIEKFGATLKIKEPTREDTDFAMFRVVYSGVLSAREAPGHLRRFHPNQKFSRHYLLQKSSLGGTLISLPAPWIKPHDNGEAEMELLVKKNAVGEPLEIVMTINELMINTVLGYINVGAIHQATQLVSTDYAINMLYQKIDNPFAAAVGGYLLILGANQKMSEPAKENWKDWITNLDNWFEWLPDGAILNAARHFWLRDYSRKNKNDYMISDDFRTSYEKSLKALNRAYERGLPFFTFGLKLMMDGFRYFANEGDDRAKQRLAVLETIANQTDPSQPFLTINFSHHR